MDQNFEQYMKNGEAKEKRKITPITKKTQFNGKKMIENKWV